MKRLRLGVLGSGKGSNFVAIQKAIADRLLSASVEVVISDKLGAGILDHARAIDIPTFLLRQGKFKTKLEPEIEQELVEKLTEFQVDYVILAGYMRVVKEPLLKTFENRIINIHPSLLPKYKGLEAWKQALEAGETKTGCTVHLVTAGIDEGAVLGQEETPIFKGDTPEALHARIQEAEHRLFPKILQQIAERAG